MFAFLACKLKCWLEMTQTVCGLCISWHTCLMICHNTVSIEVKSQFVGLTVRLIVTCSIVNITDVLIVRRYDESLSHCPMLCCEPQFFQTVCTLI